MTEVIFRSGPVEVRSTDRLVVRTMYRLMHHGIDPAELAELADDDAWPADGSEYR